MVRDILLSMRDTASRHTRQHSPRSTPPQSPEAEQAVLGTVLLDPFAASTAVEILKPEDFYDERNRKVMKAVVHLFQAGERVDVVSVTDLLRTWGELEDVGGVTYLTHVEGQAKPLASLDYYAKLVKGKALIRRMIDAASSVVAEGYETSKAPEEYLDWAEHTIYRVGEERLRGEIRPLGEVVDDAAERIRGIFSRGQDIRGIPTRFKELDRMLLGLQPSDMIVIAGRPSMGKTAFALNIAINATCYSDKYHVLFCSLEMSEQQVADRVLCIYKGIDSNSLRSGRLSRRQLEAVEEARENLRGAPLYIDDTPRLTTMELRAKARRMKVQKKLDMVIVDYLQFMEPSNKDRTTREQQVSEISRGLKALAKELHIPVVVLSQLSRAPEVRHQRDHRPMLSDLRESGSIEQDADVVMFLYRPAYYEKDENKKEELRNELEVDVQKQRNGPTGRVRLAFIPETMRVTDKARHGESSGY